MTTVSGPKRRAGRWSYAMRLGQSVLVALWAGLRPAGAAEATTNAPPAKTGGAATNAAPTGTSTATTNAPPAKAEESAKAEAKSSEAPAALTPEQRYEGGTNSFKNWIEVGGGGFMVKGDAGQAEQQQQMKRGAYGGIEDLHVEGNIDKKTTLTLDGHGIFDDHDYQLSLNVKREDTGYVRLSFENFRTWSDSSGGFFGPDRLHFSTASEGLPLDDGKVSFEAGWTPKKGPKVTFKYTHKYRDGDETSTIWGPVNTSLGTRDIFPNTYNIDEKSD
ncbi:MAG TPA: hypothetical protein VN829_05660, partial [Dongiaceae bacterium]|nr:hypothetical protein [Dongiaceae bacterium]